MKDGLVEEVGDGAEGLTLQRILKYGMEILECITFSNLFLSSD